MPGPAITTMARNREMEAAVLQMRPEFARRLLLRAAIAAAAVDPESWLAVIPYDIVKYVIEPYVPDLRRGADYMHSSMALAMCRDREFIDQYGAKNSNGETLFDEHIPILDRTRLDTLCSTAGLSSDEQVACKFIGDAFVMLTDRELIVRNSSGERRLSSNGDHFLRCLNMGGGILQLQSIGSQGIGKSQLVSYNTVSIEDPTISIEMNSIVSEHLLPCGLMLFMYPTGLYDPQTNRYITMELLRDHHYDDFGEAYSMPNCIYHDSFNPTFGIFIMS